MATQELMSKTTPSGFAAIRKSSGSERRGSRRCKITQLLRLRPSDPEREHFEDLRGTLSVSRSGVYFHSSELGYELGMRLFITLPYANDPATMSREYLAEVVPSRWLGTPFPVFGGWGICLTSALEHLHCPVPQYPQLPVQRMPPRQESQYGRPSLRQPVHRDSQPHIAPRKFHSG